MKYNKENTIKVVGWILILISNYLAIKVYFNPLIIVPAQGLQVTELEIRTIALCLILSFWFFLGIALICKK